MSHPPLELRVLGPVGISRAGVPVPLPSSRKVRALLAFLALEPASQSRARLCDLLWDGPNDPRGELRWSLSKLRTALDDDDRRRVVRAGPDQIGLDLSDCIVDALELERATKAGIEQASSERLAALRDLVGGELLEGIEIDGSPEFAGWLAAQRLRYRTMRVALLAALVPRIPAASEERLRPLGDWLRLAPFDPRAHELLLDGLAKCGRVRDAEEHLAATLRAFEQEGLDGAALRQAWLVARAGRVELTPTATSASVQPEVATSEPRPRRRRSVAVMPFTDASSGERQGRSAVADGLTEDIITRLAKLRVLFVIARGTVYALDERGVGTREAGRLLNVEYVVSGAVRRHGARISVVLELAETEDARIVWSDQIDDAVDDTFLVLDTIVDRIVSAIAGEIESAECARALLRPPSSLDAWEAYHRGLWHMYKFNGPDNRQAEQFFRSALALDATFSRAYAGLSFTHFQNAFLGLTEDPARQIELAFATASQSLAADERDPAAHWAMGRAHWLKKRDTESLIELERSVELSPNFALGHYTLGFVRSQAGDPRAAIEATDRSRELSPFDPLQFGMLASRAVAHVRLGQVTDAADWALRAAARPNAHTHILSIAAACLTMARREDEARALLAQIRERAPGYGVAEFLRAFHFDADTAARFRAAAQRIGFDARR
jgi:TolB-like protein/DNA-binding SARP family transcriptional activator